MVQVRRSCCARTVHADLPGIQLVVAFQLVSSRSVRRSLRHPSGFISHLSGCHCCRSGVSWPFILTWRIHLNIAATPIVSTTAYPIVFSAFDNILAVPNILDASRLDLLAPGQSPTKKSFVVEDDDDWVSWFS